MSDDWKLTREPIGEDLGAVLRGEQEDREGISPNYEGDIDNAIPGYRGNDGLSPQEFANSKGYDYTTPNDDNKESEEDFQKQGD